MLRPCRGRPYQRRRRQVRRGDGDGHHSIVVRLVRFVDIAVVVRPHQQVVRPGRHVGHAHGRRHGVGYPYRKNNGTGGRGQLGVRGVPDSVGGEVEVVVPPRLGIARPLVLDRPRDLDLLLRPRRGRPYQRRRRQVAGCTTSTRGLGRDLAGFGAFDAVFDCRNYIIVRSAISQTGMRIRRGNISNLDSISLCHPRGSAIVEIV